MRLVGVRGIELAQPAAFSRRPVRQVILRGAREGIRIALAQSVQIIIERLDQRVLGDRAGVFGHEDPVQGGGDQRSTVRAQQMPRRMVPPQSLDLLVPQCPSLVLNTVSQGPDISRQGVRIGAEGCR